jgi:hypothetical protein
MPKMLALAVAVPPTDDMSLSCRTSATKKASLFRDLHRREFVWP